MQRLRSLRHRFWYGVSRRVRWSRGAFRETPVRELSTLTPEQSQRITALQSCYQVHFELQMNARTAVNNYEYLDILDRGFAFGGLNPTAGGVVCDVGCASFWYASALQAFFSPRELIGVEVEGHRLFKDGRTRIDYASGYLAQLPNARFIVANYVRCRARADVITAWFPFVTPAAILAWRLPLSLLTPEKLFERICHNLTSRGFFVMVNHGPAEAERASILCGAAGLRCQFRFDETGVFSAQRGSPALLSVWRPA